MFDDGCKKKKKEKKEDEESLYRFFDLFEFLFFVFFYSGAQRRTRSISLDRAMIEMSPGKANERQPIRLKKKS